MTEHTMTSSAPIGVRARMRHRGANSAGLIAALAAGAGLPFVVGSDSFILVLMSHALIAGLVALSLDMLLGTTGLMSFGHGAWYGLGAYVAGIMAKSTSTEILLCVAVATVSAALLAAAVGFILVRQVGKAFAILTLALGQIVYTAIFLAPGLTGGEDGLQGIPVPTFFGRAINEFQTWYWILYGCVLAAVLGALFVRRSPLGNAWAAIRENPERAQFIGMNVARLKLLSYVISAALAAAAGALFAFFNGGVSPETLQWFESGKILMCVILGGVGTFVGPVLGGMVFTIAQHYISSVSNAWFIYFGLLMIALVLFAPRGIQGLWTAALAQLRKQPEPRP
jgi:branched-chain amino acid transport system permease protein